MVREEYRHSKSCKCKQSSAVSLSSTLFTVLKKFYSFCTLLINTPDWTGEHKMLLQRQNFPSEI